MNLNCNVCGNPLGEPIYRSLSGHVLTSLCEVRSGNKRVWSCLHCGHLRGEALPDTGKYYATDYRISLDQDDEDQIYEVRDDRVVYRTEHQVDTLIDKLPLPQGALMLDYGCAKASTFKRLLTQRTDLQAHLFDVSDMYTAHWDRFVIPERRAVHVTPPSWQGRFDVVTSFFALEHIPEPRKSVQSIASLLKDDGIFYGIVPNTFGNVADFIVIDHVNHFTIPSLHALLEGAGFVQIDIDARAHRGALVFLARKEGTASGPMDVKATLARSQDLASYWTRLSDRIRSEEDAHGGVPAAIYGSGFYGAYIASSLQRPDRLRNFLDHSPYQQGKVLLGKPVLAPEQLPDDIRLLYVGLNPAIARATIEKKDWLLKRNLQLVFLDESDR